MGFRKKKENNEQMNDKRVVSSLFLQVARAFWRRFEMKRERKRKFAKND